MEFEDRREEALNDITDEEMESIKDTFQTYDIDGDGGISKTEMLQLIRDRAIQRKHVITEKFDIFKAAEQEELRRVTSQAEAQLSRGILKPQVRK